MTKSSFEILKSKNPILTKIESINPLIESVNLQLLNFLKEIYSQAKFLYDKFWRVAQLI